jgi:hypothetical protein
LNRRGGSERCSGSAGNGEQAFSVSVNSALRAGIFKASGVYLSD